MTSYVCKYGLYHDKPTVDAEPSSNNGWIYTAYAKALGIPVSSLEHYQDLNTKCIPTDFHYDFIRTRLPEKKTPPISRDELIGMQSLGNDLTFMLDVHGWNMSKVVGSSDTYLEALIILFAIRKEHRNFVWESSLYKAYKLAFGVMSHDRYYFKKSSKFFNFSPNLYELLMFNLYCFTTIIQKDHSARNVLWLQLIDLKSKFWIKFLRDGKSFKEYFSKDHPFYKEWS